MANIPHKFTQEAEDSRSRDKKLKSNNATTLVFGGYCFKDCANRGELCRSCFKGSEFKSNG